MLETSRKIATLVLLAISLAASAEECDNACQELKVEEYFNLLSEVYREDSEESDIERLFSIFSSDVTYEHLNYEASFSREEWRNAFLDNQRRGAYRNGPNRFMNVEQYIHGKGYVAVSYSHVLRSEDGSLFPEGDQKLLALFGMTDGRISSVQEYW